ncbi:hypothetical protein GALMADRAFT_78608 [Galerina marginata CBS 339.88]|uniref:Uncharacterized protein n=1 Tax=Galerina marginata (strain CBS 339.88) TaxID=685588 RepID=A0A067SBP3_GALM3|nr:hypothetical protein GALMADRAFT_78608 [Galerina marginata CBS 339.88]
MTYSSTTLLSKPSPRCSDSFDDPQTSDGYFAFARIKGDVCLVQASNATPASALTAVDVKVFRHEFISIFRFSESCTLHPSDICILEPIDDRLTRYEEDNETVFLARNVMERMRKLTDPRWNFGLRGQKQMNQNRTGLLVRQRQRQR